MTVLCLKCHFGMVFSRHNLLAPAAQTDAAVCSRSLGLRPRNFVCWGAQVSMLKPGIARTIFVQDQAVKGLAVPPRGTQELFPRRTTIT